MKERVAFIGAGNVAWHLSQALYAAGYGISAIASRRKASAKKLAQHFRAAYAKDPADILSNETHVFITTPDSAISSVADHLCKNKLLRKNQLVIHTSGLHSTEAIDCVKKLGALPLSMHPAFSFSSCAYTENELQGVWFVLQGSKVVLGKGRKIARSLKAKSIVLAAEKKPLYHLALVFACNLFVGIEDMSLELLTRCGIKRETAEKLILPLVGSTLTNVKAKGTRKALSGPVERGDISTIRKHLAELSKHERAYRKSYLELSNHLVTMVKENGELPNETIRAIKKLLKD